MLIPATNVANLMIRKDVVEAVKEGKFHVYAIKTIDEGIEILTGMAAGKYLEDGSYPVLKVLVTSNFRHLCIM